MKRLIDPLLIDWKSSSRRKPLLIRGARQVGKTYAVRKLARHFDSLVEINLEAQPELCDLFEKNLDPHRLAQALALVADQKIVPGKTLLFLDEIQQCPRAILALRYFYEQMPELHVIAAGSLLEFGIAQVGLPVGRVESLYLHPVSFFEFLAATGHHLLIEELLNHRVDEPFATAIHEKALTLVATYLAIGGMPEVVREWAQSQNPQECFRIHHTLLDGYQQDFNKYAKKLQIKYLDLLFHHIPQQLGHTFVYNRVAEGFRKRELAPCLELLSTAKIIQQVILSPGQGIPLGAEAKPSHFKAIFLDVGLCQSLLGLDLKQWFLSPQTALTNQGPLMEAFVGQELLAYAPPEMRPSLYYWQRLARGSNAEVDYLITLNNQVIPVEVKSGTIASLRSLHQFLETHPNSPHGLRFSPHNFSQSKDVWSYPLYAIPTALSECHDIIRRALLAK